MKIAIIGSCKFQIPTEKGVIHAPLILTYKLAYELAKMGHDVTYFGKVDPEYAKTLAPLKIESPEYFDLPALEGEYKCTESVRYRAGYAYHQNYIARIIKRYPDFELYYSWAAVYVGPLAALCKKPIVATHHDSTNMKVYNLMFKGFDEENLFMVPISNYMDKQIEFSNKLPVVHHGMDPNEMPLSEPENYFCWLGRISPAKGPHIAIEAAIKAGANLKIAGPISDYLPDFGDITEYNKRINKLISDNSNIEYLGSLSQEESYEFISKAKGLIFPTDGTESFSMVVLEAMMAGTPVISTNLGPIPELVKEGINGILLNSQDNIDGIVNAMAKIDSIDRAQCRADAAERFSLIHMAKGYENNFQKALEKWKANC